ncbi:tyrosine-protein phosphatase [Desulfoluna butyratoxydans]|uniref:protein-tyrosine-phosphatase n=1 Tax=Desulfoluna butyratoxydans TaxID=231438 RepID=A0A4U8YZG6_9BACT|nr:CpsB/CapC family capsule biosynthesis tyrosine phosphatase [Desulfoluna butyratoxydans]VFQ47173.1 polymerase/histidinol phosphatase-like [Desulfoluna butyratoxydans]
MPHTRWTDIHCHILPGVDDGSDDMAETLVMAAQADKGGTSCIAATFHAGVDLLDALCYRPLIDKLNRRFREEGIGVTLVPGAEVVAGFMPDNLEDFTINGSRYLLVEFPSSHLPRVAVPILRAYLDRGLHPIIAHPERNPSIIRDPNRLFEMVAETGSLVQVTADSVAGTFGREIASCARYLLKKGAVDIMGSDAHDENYRTTDMSDGVKAASKVIGEQAALRLVRDNPQAVVEDCPVEGRSPSVVRAL